MAIQGSRSVEERLDEVLDLVHALTKRVDELDGRLSAREAGVQAPATHAADSPTKPVVDASPSMMGWVRQSRLLERIAMVSFALAIALVLRTLTDSRLIGVGVGVGLGILYSALLVALGFWLLSRHRHGQRVLPICGAVLLCSVALEANRKFQLISADTANWILIADLLIVSSIGLRFRMGSIMAFAVLAPVVSAFAVGFPNLQFPLAALVFFLANVFAYVARRVGRLQWLAWTTFAMTLFLWLLWSAKLRAHVLHPEQVPAAGLGSGWFLPWLAVFALLYTGTAVFRSVAAPRAPGMFHAFLPTGNVIWAHSAGAAVLGPVTGGLFGLGAVALGAGVGHLAFAAWLWRRLREHATGITSFTLAGTLLLALAVPGMVGSLALEACVLSALGLGLALFATVCRSPSLRLCALLLQVVVCGLVLVQELYAVPPTSLLTTLLAGATVAALSARQYRHDRNHPPPPESWFARLDPRNHGSILLLWTAAVHAFGILRVLLGRALLGFGVETPSAFPCGQSVILNSASIAVLLWGMHTRNRQVLLTSVLVAIVGGLKVFGSDLLSTSGLPLVLSVLSFGLAATVGSIVLGRLQWANASADAGGTKT